VSMDEKKLRTHCLVCSLLVHVIGCELVSFTSIKLNHCSLLSRPLSSNITYQLFGVITNSSFWFLRMKAATAFSAS